MPLLAAMVTARIFSVTIRNQLSGLLFPMICSLGMFGVIQILVAILAPFEHIAGLLKIFAIIAAAVITYLGLLRTLNRDSWSAVGVAVHAVLMSKN